MRSLDKHSFFKTSFVQFFSHAKVRQSPWHPNILEVIFSLSLYSEGLPWQKFQWNQLQWNQVRRLSNEWRYLGEELLPQHNQEDYKSLDILGKAQQGVLYNERNYPYTQWATTFSYHATLKAITFFTFHWPSQKHFQIWTSFLLTKWIIIKHFSHLYPSTVCCSEQVSV